MLQMLQSLGLWIPSNASDIKPILDSFSLQNEMKYVYKANDIWKLYQMKYLYKANDSQKLYFMKYWNKANDTWILYQMKYLYKAIDS